MLKMKTKISTLAIFMTFGIVFGIAEKLGDHRNLALHHAVKEMLNFKSSKTPNTKHESQKFNKNLKNLNNNPASYYMKELFKKWYQGNSDDAFNSKIVRSITPKLVVGNSKAALSFNLHALRPSEHLIKAEIHFNAAGISNRKSRRHSKTRKYPKIRCFALLTSPSNGTTALQRELPLVSHEYVGSSVWLIFDSTTAIEASIRSSQGSTTNNNRVIVTFSFDAYHSPKHHTVSWVKKLLHRHSPFLLLFTEDKLGTTDNKRFMSSLLSSPRLYKSGTNASILIGQNGDSGGGGNGRANRAKRYVDEKARDKNVYDSKYYQYSYTGGDPVGHFPNENSTRGVEKYDKRQENHFTVSYIQKGPKILQDSKAARKNNKKMKSKKKYSKHRNSKMLPPVNKYFDTFGQESANDVTAHLKEKSKSWMGDDSNSGRNQQKHVTQNGRKDQTGVVLLGAPEQQTGCQKRDLVVEFRDIGWADWIIAPKSFEAHYCAGTCLFPLSAKSNPSNHAIIQSIVHAAGLHPGVPEISCAPDKMDSVTLLYFDEDQNVVLKNYPKMTVSSCSCL